MVRCSLVFLLFGSSAYHNTPDAVIGHLSIMGAFYTIFGRKVPAYQLSMATIAALGLTIAYATRGDKSQELPKIEASSSEEEKFILDYIKKAEEQK